MNYSVKSMIVGVLLAAVGFAIGWVTRGGAPVELVEREAIGSGHLASRLGGPSDLAEPLARLEAILAAFERQRVDIPSGSPSRVPVAEGRPRDDFLAPISEKLDEILLQVQLGAAGLDELSRMRPEPDMKELIRVRKESLQDRDQLVQRVRGQAYRDAIRAFGMPTKKESNGDKIGDGAVAWYWDVPDLGVAFCLMFAGGEAYWAQFVSRELLKSDRP